MGSIAAYRTQLQVGEQFQAVEPPNEGGAVHKEAFTVVGILAPTGTPADRAIFVNMKGFQEIHHHEEVLAGETPTGSHGHDAAEDITAILVCIPKADADMGRDDLMIALIDHDRDTPQAQAVKPTFVIASLFESVVGKLEWVLLGMAVVTVIEAGIGIMVSMYNSMSDRRHEIAIMRALGASRFIVMLIILLESILLSLLGGSHRTADRPRNDMAPVAQDRRLDRRGHRPVPIPIARVDFDPRPDFAGLRRRLHARDGRVSDRRGEVVDYDAVGRCEWLVASG